MHHSPAIRPRSGFTLIELMAATTLAGMLMIVTMGLLIQVQESAEDIQASVESTTWLHNLRQQLQQDFANCRSVRIERNRVRIDGYSQHQPNQGQVRQLPAIITYTLQSGWLIREQQRSTGNINDISSSQMMGYGVQNLEDLSNLDVDVPPGRWRLKITYQDLQSSPGNNRSKSVTWTLFRHGGGVE